jgi:hypothetical protein
MHWAFGWRETSIGCVAESRRGLLAPTKMNSSHGGGSPMSVYPER